MRTPKSDTPKSTPTTKKTPPSKKSSAATKARPITTESSTTTPKSSTETKRTPTTRTKQFKPNDPPIPTPQSDPHVPPADEAKVPADVVQVTSGSKVAPGKKTVRKVVKRTVVRKKTSASAGAASSQTPKSGESSQANLQDSPKKEEVESANDTEPLKKEEQVLLSLEESSKMENVANVEDPTEKEETSRVVQQLSIEKIGKSPELVDSVIMEEVKLLENQEPCMAKGDEVMEEGHETKIIENKMEPKEEPVKMEEDPDENLEVEEDPLEEDVQSAEKIDYGDEEALEIFGAQDLAEDDVLAHGEEAEAREEEHAQLDAVKERKIEKELEIFVGGLDRDAVEGDVKKVFENVGVVVDVRLHRDLSNNKNKGYAFVKFATKEQASRALSEMRNPVICGKRCGTAPSEDNDTLFLGNICNTWTKEAIKQKLKDYGIEGVENITLVSDPQHEGLSRGFAFIEFSCHPDAMLAYKRLQRPDVIFGHLERTAKVAFAEPLREPDPEVMAQVKSVFVDGLPPHWDEDRVREKFKDYGDIERIMLARNMSTAKRKDFGFVDFTTHEAAVACIEGVNNADFGDGNVKSKVRARLSNPSPKIQAVKGGMCGGFRIGQGSHGIGGNFSKFGRGFGRVGQPFGRANFQRGGGFHQRGRSQAGRMGFANEPDRDNPYPPFHGRQNYRGGRWGSVRGAHQASGGSAFPPRTDLDRQRHGATDRSRGDHVSFRGEPFPPEEGFNRPFVGRHFDDPYFYDDAAHGMKRPYFMTDQDPDYMEPSRLRPRLDYSDPGVPVRGTRNRDTFAAGSGFYSHGYYGSDHGGSSYSSFYGGDRPYGGGYYY